MSADILWTPSDDRVARANLTSFAAAAPGSPEDYEALWRWSVDQPEAFWALAWDHCGVVASQRFDSVTAGEGMPGTRWFPGARLNYAENLLAGGPDRLAVISAGEGQPTRRFTNGDLRRDVARVQAALTAMGVGPGDRVC
ncbi:MAG TPA: acetyl-coenzyme A synthetase N-terminal domain-containing protein, partial [Euzebya sp.]|nr:acetyl-coenzyme A synthetase N-terminal domain-containing protein [Euzebya sp.]